MMRMNSVKEDRNNQTQFDVSDSEDLSVVNHK